MRGSVAYRCYVILRLAAATAIRALVVRLRWLMEDSTHWRRNECMLLYDPVLWFIEVRLITPWALNGREDWEEMGHRQIALDKALDRSRQ